MLRWSRAAPWWSNLLGGVAIGIIASAVRHALLGADYRLTYVIFFPFVSLASLIGRPVMGAATIVVTALYVRTILSLNHGATPFVHLFAYMSSAAIIVAIGDGLMRALAAAEADRRRSRAAESFHASLVRSSNDAIITKTLDDVITSWNPAATLIFGYEAHEAIGQPVAMLSSPHHLAGEDEFLARIAKGEAIEHFVTVRKAKSGALIDVSLTLSPISDETGAVVGVSKILRDVTKAKQVADALQDSEQLLRFALQAAKAGTWQRDYLSGKYTWSPRFYEMHGVDPESRSPSFENWSERVLEGDRDSAARGIQSAFQSAATEYFSNYRVLNAAGEIRWIEVYGKIERQTDGSIGRTTGISLDVTERQRVVEAFAVANKDLLRANDSLKKFSSIAAHDLQEPLRKVEQYGDLLQTEYAERFEGDGVFYIQVMRDSARRMRALINALLNFSRAANRELTMRPMDMNDVIKQVLVACAAAIEETGAAIQIDNLPALFGDAVLVTQLFQNLITNAIKYTKPGLRPAIHVGDGGAGQNVSIYVRDEGIGIDPEHQEIIFEAFTRLNTREKVKGTGIGLAFCRTVCERHGWRLEVQSKRNGGSVFSVTAPRQRVNQAA